MSLALDPATEQRIQRLARGPYSEPAELINHALDLLEDEEAWLQTKKQAIHDRIEQSFAAVERGETYTPEQARQSLAEGRAQH